jgi:hypothetical protein
MSGHTRDMVVSSTFEAFRHLDRAQRLAGNTVQLEQVWYGGSPEQRFGMERLVLCSLIYHFFADTYAPARFGAIPLLSVPDR